MLSKSDLTAISRVVRRQITVTSLTKVWINFHHEEGFGVVTGNDIHFRASDLENLRFLVMDQVGIDPLYEEVNGDRIDAATQTRNEKLSTQGVFSDLVLVARFPPLPIPTTNGESMTPQASLLALPANQVLITNLSQVVVIENGAAMKAWSSFLWPTEVNSAVFLYRGHGRNLHDVRSISANAQQAVAFYDFDPAGLLMALEANFSGLLLPEPWAQWTTDNEFIRRFNKPQIYHSQHLALAKLKELKHPTLTAVINHIEENQLAITQEHILAHKIALQYFPLATL